MHAAERRKRTVTTAATTDNAESAVKVQRIGVFQSKLRRVDEQLMHIKPESEGD